MQVCRQQSTPQHPPFNGHKRIYICAILFLYFANLLQILFTEFRWNLTSCYIFHILVVNPFSHPRHTNDSFFCNGIENAFYNQCIFCLLFFYLRFTHLHLWNSNKHVQLLLCSDFLNMHTYVSPQVSCLPALPRPRSNPLVK